MTHDDRLAHHLRDLVETVVPDGLRPDPPLSARLRQGRAAALRGWLTLAAALLVIVAGAALVSRLPAGAPPLAAPGPADTSTPTTIPTLTPTPVPPITLAAGGDPQTIRLSSSANSVLLRMPEEPVEIVIEVVGQPPSVTDMVGLFLENRLLLVGFYPLQTAYLRLALRAPVGPLNLMVMSTSGMWTTQELRLSVVAFTPQSAEVPLEALPEIPLDLPAGTVAVALPDALTGVMGGTLTVDQPVDVYLTMLFVDVDGEFQAPLVTMPPAAATAILDDSVGPATAPRVTTQRAVEGATVIGLGGEMITLAVRPQDANTLAWAIEAHMPITLIPLAGD